MGLTRSHMDDWEATRRHQAAQHDDGAAEALRAAVEMDVKCGSYCYGGSATLDVQETLAELCVDGWRLVRVADPEDGS